MWPWHTCRGRHRWQPKSCPLNRRFNEAAAHTPRKTDEPVGPGDDAHVASMRPRHTHAMEDLQVGAAERDARQEASMRPRHTCSGGRDLDHAVTFRGDVASMSPHMLRKTTFTRVSQALVDAALQ
jgi:hypothetical protein